MATIGLKMLYTGLKDDAGNVITGDDGLSDTGVFEIDTNKENGNLGTKTANISNISGNVTKISGNNQVVDVSKAAGAPTVAIDSNMINPTAKEKMLGRVKNEAGLWVDGDKPVETGLIIESQSPIYRNSVFFCFGRGVMTQSSQNVQTNTDTAETREDDNLTFTAIAYEPFNSQALGIAYESDKDFDKQKMFDMVFPNNTYDAKTGKAKANTTGK